MNFYTFTRDIGNLYYKTGIPSIEKCYIQCVKNYNAQLADWILENEDIRSNIPDPNVYDALIDLVKLRSKFKDGVNSVNFLQYIISNPIPSLPIIISFQKLIDDSLISEILDPFRDIIMATLNLSVPSSKDIPDLNAIKESLDIIAVEFQKYQEKEEGEGEDKGAYWGVKRPKQKEKILMFSKLLQNISTEIASAADRNKMPELASVMRDGSLVKQSVMENIVEIDISQYMWGQAMAMAKYVMKNLGDINFAHNLNFVKEKSLDFVGLITPQELLDLYNRRETEQDTSAFMDPDNVDESSLMGEEEGISSSDADILNPHLLSMLTAFFVSLYSLLR